MKTYHFESRNSTLKNYWKTWFAKQKIFKLQENFVWKMFSEKYFSNTSWSNCSMTTSYHQFRRQSGGTHLHSIYAPADWKLKCQNEEKTISFWKIAQKLFAKRKFFNDARKFCIVSSTKRFYLVIINSCWEITSDSHFWRQGEANPRFSHLWMKDRCIPPHLGQ